MGEEWLRSNELCRWRGCGRPVLSAWPSVSPASRLDLSIVVVGVQIGLQKPCRCRCRDRDCYERQP